jgi:very-short-patch-repair endonuclease
LDVFKKQKMCGFDFHRQKPIDEYIMDFFCYELMLGIEVDGYSHLLEEVQKKDIEKEKRMHTLGISVLRFKDEEVFMQIENILLCIKKFIANQKIKNNTINPPLEKMGNNINTPLPLSRGEQQP